MPPRRSIIFPVLSVSFASALFLSLSLWSMLVACAFDILSSDRASDREKLFEGCEWERGRGEEESLLKYEAFIAVTQRTGEKRRFESRHPYFPTKTSSQVPRIYCAFTKASATHTRTPQKPSRSVTRGGRCCAFVCVREGRRTARPVPGIENHTAQETMEVLRNALEKTSSTHIGTLWFPQTPPISPTPYSKFQSNAIFQCKRTRQTSPCDSGVLVCAALPARQH